LKIWEFFWDSNSQHGSSLVSVRVRSLTPFAFSGAWSDSRVSLLANLATPCLGCEPKAKVATTWDFGTRWRKVHQVLCHHEKPMKLPSFGFFLNPKWIVIQNFQNPNVKISTFF
jgi:hypothetical protein